MPLEILLVLVIGGIAGIALALHLLGMTGAPTLTIVQAQAAWLREFPDSVIHDVTLSPDGRAAGITDDTGRGLVWQMGADTCARRLNGGEKIESRGNRMVLRLGDYAAPRLALTLPPEDRDRWTRWIKETS
ncbi:MAG: hypothetical protein AAFN94_12835 [Pseudomonadota bacterium]